MTEPFDPYLRWLGIRDTERPPNHYRLLGVGLFEADPDVLSNAADRQMAHIRTFQSGKHSAESQKLLNELAMAKVCVLNAAKKAAYDAQLQAILAKDAVAPVVPVIPPAAPPAELFAAGPEPVVSPELLEEALAVDADGSDQVLAAFNPRLKLFWPLTILGVSLVVVLGLITVFTGGDPRRHLPPTETETKPSAVETAVAPEPPPKLPEVAAPTMAEQRTQERKTSEKPSPLVESPSKPEPFATSPKAAETTPDARVEPPTDEVLAIVVKEIRQIYKDSYAAAKERDQRRGLAQMLQQKATDTRDNPTSRFALLIEARDVAVQAGDAKILDTIFASLAHDYQIDEDAMTEETLVKAAKKSRDATANQVLGRFALEKAKTTICEDRFERVKLLADAARDMARKAHDPATIKQATAIIKDIDHREQLRAVFPDAEQQLVNKPEDAKANLTAAGYYCLVKDDWARGLMFVLKTGDASLKAAASADMMQAPATPIEMVSLADRWFDAQKSADEEGRSLARIRAIYWYRMAEHKASGLTLNRIERRLTELEE